MESINFDDGVFCFSSSVPRTQKFENIVCLFRFDSVLRGGECWAMLTYIEINDHCYWHRHLRAPCLFPLPVGISSRPFFFFGLISMLNFFVVPLLFLLFLGDITKGTRQMFTSALLPTFWPNFPHLITKHCHSFIKAQTTKSNPGSGKDEIVTKWKCMKIFKQFSAQNVANWKHLWDIEQLFWAGKYQREKGLQIFHVPFATLFYLRQFWNWVLYIKMLSAILCLFSCIL